MIINISLKYLLKVTFHLFAIFILVVERGIGLAHHFQDSGEFVIFGGLIIMYRTAFLTAIVDNVSLL